MNTEHILPRVKAPGIGRRTFTRTLARAAAVLALGTGVLLASPVAPASAHADTVFQLDFFDLFCEEETDGIGADDPYVVFFAGNLATSAGVVSNTPEFDMDSGEHAGTPGQPRVWNGVIAQPSDLIVLAAVIERDGSSIRSVVDTVRARMLPNMLAYRNAGQSRATIVANLRADMDNAIATGKGIGDPSNEDDQISNTKELALTAGQRLDAHNGQTVFPPVLRFRDNGDDATYEVKFRLRRP